MGQHQHEPTTYILESASTAARELSHHSAAIQGAEFEESKDISEGNEDKDGLDQSKLLKQEITRDSGREQEEGGWL